MELRTEFDIALNNFIASGSHNCTVEQAFTKTGTLLAASRSISANSDKPTASAPVPGVSVRCSLKGKEFTIA